MIERGGEARGRNSANLVLREGTPADASDCGRIFFDAFMQSEGSTPFPSVEASVEGTGRLISNPGFYGVVAEQEGRIVGSNFLDERSAINGVGPLTVDPVSQDADIGRSLMEAVMDRATERGVPGVRLVTPAGQTRPFVLYTKLGFRTRLTLSQFSGRPFKANVPGTKVRQAQIADLGECDALCARVHGHDRSGELRQGIDRGLALVVERGGRITGYNSMPGILGHSIGEANEDLRALIGSGSESGPLPLFVPNDNHELLRWCYANGLRMDRAMTLMTVGLYNEPDGAYLPSVFF